MSKCKFGKITIIIFIIASLIIIGAAILLTIFAKTATVEPMANEKTDKLFIPPLMTVVNNNNNNNLDIIRSAEVTDEMASDFVVILHGQSKLDLQNQINLRLQESSKLYNIAMDFVVTEASLGYVDYYAMLRYTLK